MCPLHIRQCLAEIRRQLDDGGDRCVRVVATQLVEAGVDLDFPGLPSDGGSGLTASGGRKV